jgi:hypothetical protein
MANGGGNGVAAVVGVAAHCGEARRRIQLKFRPGFGLRFGFLRSRAAIALFECLTGAGEGVSLFMDQALDFKDQLDFAAAVKALAGSTLVGSELGKLGLPKAQDVGLKTADSGDVSNFEVEAVGDRR